MKLLDMLFAKRVIVNCDRDPYLIRWYVIRSKPFAVFLHKFIRSDEDRALHDHPWNFIVIPLWRGYHEHSDRGRRRVWPIIGARFRRGDYKHRVELLPCDDSRTCTYFQDPNEFDVEEDCPKCAGTGTMPSWSLFIRFREFREWGFWMPEGWIQWNRWWQDKCE